MCRDELLTLRYDGNRHKPMRLRFHEQRGVTVRIADYGTTASAPFYEPMYEALEAAGYTRDKDIRVAGYDARLTPDMGGFLERTKRLIERTWRDNGRRPVHLVGHSNGPIYIQYLLTHTSRAWKATYIHGFTPLAGNFPGQGLGYALMFVGLNVPDLLFPATPENAVSSARMFLSHPSTYITASDPRIFHDLEVVIRDQSTGTSYTPQDYPRLLRDAGLGWALPIARHYIGGVPFADPAHFPNVDVYAEKGSGIETLVGLGLADLTVGQLVTGTTELITRDGDINQEDLTNDAVTAWSAMRCWHFSLTDSPGREPLRAAERRGRPRPPHRERQRAAVALPLARGGPRAGDHPCPPPQACRAVAIPRSCYAAMVPSGASEAGIASVASASATDACGASDASSARSGRRSMATTRPRCTIENASRRQWAGRLGAVVTVSPSTRRPAKPKTTACHSPPADAPWMPSDALPRTSPRSARAASMKCSWASSAAPIRAASRAWMAGPSDEP